MGVSKIQELIEKRDYITVKKRLSEMNKVDVAETLKPLEPHMTLLLFRMLPKDLAVDVFAHFSSKQRLEIISSITDKELENIIEELFFDDMIDLIEEMPANIVNKILVYAKDDERKLINQFLKYPADSAGSLMTIEYVELRKHMSVKESMAHIKQIGLNRETVYTCYVTDNNRTLEGFISLRTLVTSDENLIIADIMKDGVINVNTHDDQEIVAQSFRRYGFLALPVVDKENKLTGIITVDDIIDVIEQEATEDFQIMAAMFPSEEEYLDTSVFQLAKNRLPWLMILMISGIFTGSIMSKYEDILSSVVVLATFIPMLMDTGGNSGSQSSTLTIRGLALGEIMPSDLWKVLFKELKISFLVGMALVIVNFTRLMLFDKAGIPVTLTVSITLLLIVMSSKIVGGVLPLAAKKLNMDPAIMAGPLITTMVDGISLVVYFTLATKLLGL